MMSCLSPIHCLLHSSNMSSVKDTSIITLKLFPNTQGYKPVNHKAA